MAIVSFFITYYEVTRNSNFNINEFYAYPLSTKTLYLPIFLTIIVLIAYYIYPNTKIIILVWLLTIRNHIHYFISSFVKHILEELPKMKSEISLFLIAGMLGILLSSILIGFNFKIASLFLLSFILLVFIGIHPIITNSSIC